MDMNDLLAHSVDVQVQQACNFLLEVVLFMQFTCPLPLLEPPLSTLVAAPLAGISTIAAVVLGLRPGAGAAGSAPSGHPKRLVGSQEIQLHGLPCAATGSTRQRL